MRFLNKIQEKTTISPKKETISPFKKIFLFISENVSRIKNFISKLFSSEGQSDNPFKNDPDFWTHYKILSLKKNIKTQQVKNSRLIDLIAIHNNPLMAMDIANSLAQAYIEYTRFSSFEATKVAI